MAAIGGVGTWSRTAPPISHGVRSSSSGERESVPESNEGGAVHGVVVGMTDQFAECLFDGSEASVCVPRVYCGEAVDQGASVTLEWNRVSYGLDLKLVARD
jgi:hypothetical protein